MSAMLDAPMIRIRNFQWGITDAVDGREHAVPFIFGCLSKFQSEGIVPIVDTEAKSRVNALARNLLEASAPFVYLPKYSGIAYLHVWNKIEQDVFARRFKSLIEAAYDDFFVECSIEPISDYRSFITKLNSIEIFRDIKAVVYPPNPLFGRLWGSLRKYIERRNADEVRVRESTHKSPGLTTMVVDLMSNILENPNFEPDSEPDITDAAVLMAADGYGKGQIIGTGNGQEEIVVRTSDAHRSFLYSKEPLPEELAEHTDRQLTGISNERDMKHPSDE